MEYAFGHVDIKTNDKVLPRRRFPGRTAQEDTSSITAKIHSQKQRDFEHIALGQKLKPLETRGFGLFFPPYQ